MYVATSHSEAAVALISVKWAIGLHEVCDITLAISGCHSNVGYFLALTATNLFCRIVAIKVG